jgi:phosphatidylglycerol:prolipoprotein diacylglycerol transferase
MLPILNIGKLALQTPGMILLFGLWLGLSLAEKLYPKFPIKPSHVNNLVFAGLVAMLVGGRLAYAAENLPAFIKSPVSLVSLNPSLWDLPGGLVVGLAAAGWYGARRRVPFWRLLDALTPWFGVMLVAFGLANLASGAAYGEPARLPWSINLWGEWRHPVQAYESLAALLILLFKVLLPLSRRSAEDQTRPAGLFFIEFATWSSVAFLVLGVFRANAPLIAGGVRALQVGAWIVLAACLILWGRMKKKTVTSPIHPGPPGTA